ncbi:MAG TPA: alpha-amylase family glycosyl hydrolase [Spirochaetia bacterium]|nr:alpha-amylase family glycosyl hydrolase [Spirochaetia bacterium]
MGSNPLREPEWLPGLIVYEVAPRAFTSPRGPETGTFASLTGKIPYLRELGITGIWLTGHNLAHDSHFYGIWTQYATIRPDALDERLGTREELRAMIRAAHDAGIKVFLDVITHGVMKDSPLVTEHPQWFKGGTWGMTDYDWFGDHEDLFRWWVDTWVRYGVEDGIDGYRLDVSMYRPDLWQEIKRKAQDAGHPIVVFHELGPGKRGVVDFLQRDIRMKDQRNTFDFSASYLTNMRRTLADVVANPTPSFTVDAELADGSHRTSAGDLRVRGVKRVSRDVKNGRTGDTYGEDLFEMEIEPYLDPASLRNLWVSSGEHQTWMLRDNIAADYILEPVPTAPGKRAPGSLRVRFPVRLCPKDTVSIQLSCHDDGWDGFPSGQNPYAARGSRFVFGYGFLLTPAVPIFMSGEEFDADFRPLPRLSPGLFGGSGAGQGTWLYGSWLDWEQLEEPRHREMLEDVKAIIRIRKEFARLIRPARREGRLDGFYELPVRTPAGVPVPYAYCDVDGLLMVAANPSTDQDVTLKVPVPWRSLPIRKAGSYQVRDVWRGTPARSAARPELNELTVEVRRDRVSKGGLSVVSISPA